MLQCKEGECKKNFNFYFIFYFLFFKCKREVVKNLLVNGDNPNSLNSYKKSLFQEYLQLNNECQNKIQDTFFNFLYFEFIINQKFCKNFILYLFFLTI